MVGLLAAVAGGCATPPSARVTLLPDEDGHVGVIEVKTAKGTAELVSAYASAEIKGDAASTGQSTQQTVMARYGAVLEGLPAQPQRHLLYFEFGTDKLTAQSRALLPGIEADLKRFPAPEVIVSGHTDGIGGPAYNDKLSVERAMRARDILVRGGIPAEAIQIVGRGSREPLVPNRPGVPEPKNRRVEIKLR